MTEDLTNQVDGTQSAFTTVGIFIPGSLKVYLDGARLSEGSANDYQEVSTTGLLMTAPVPIGSTLVVDYDDANAAGGGGILTASGT